MLSLDSIQSCKFCQCCYQSFLWCWGVALADQIRSCEIKASLRNSGAQLEMFFPKSQFLSVLSLTHSVIHGVIHRRLRHVACVGPMQSQMCPKECLCWEIGHWVNTGISISPQMVAGSPNKVFPCWPSFANGGALKGEKKRGGRMGRGAGEGRPWGLASMGKRLESRSVWRPDPNPCSWSAWPQSWLLFSRCRYK